MLCWVLVRSSPLYYRLLFISFHFKPLFNQIGYLTDLFFKGDLHILYVIIIYSSWCIWFYIFWATAKTCLPIFTYRSGSGRCWLGITVRAQENRRKQSAMSTMVVVSPGDRPSWPAPSCWSAPSAAGPTSATPWRTPGSHGNAHRQVHSAYR